MQAKKNYKGKNLFQLTKVQNRDYQSYRDDEIQPQFENCLKEIGIVINDDGNVTKIDKAPEQEAMQQPLVSTDTLNQI